MRTDVEVEWAVGQITRTAAGRAATFTTVWWEVKFQLCTTRLSLSCTQNHSCPLVDICTTADKLSIFYLFSSSPCLSSSHSYISPLCRLPKPQHTLKEGLQLVSKGQAWCDSEWEGGGWGEERELFKLAMIHESSTTQRRDERERELERAMWWAETLLSWCKHERRPHRCGYLTQR